MQIRYETMKLTMHPTNNAGTFTRVPGGCLRWPPTPPGPRWPPALNLELERERTKEEKEREVLHLFRCYTHTPGRSRVNPERQEEEKSGHTTGRRPKTAQGGRGTDGPPEPTYTAKRTWPKTAHTPKPHDTLRRGTRGKLGTKWGTS